MIDYLNLEKHFTSAKIISPFYNVTRIPRKLKKKVKSFCNVHYKTLDINQCLWFYLEESNPDYKRFLLKMICKQN